MSSQFISCNIKNPRCVLPIHNAREDIPIPKGGIGIEQGKIRSKKANTEEHTANPVVACSIWGLWQHPINFSEFG